MNELEARVEQLEQELAFLKAYLQECGYTEEWKREVDEQRELHAKCINHLMNRGLRVR